MSAIYGEITVSSNGRVYRSMLSEPKFRGYSGGCIGVINNLAVPKFTGRNGVSLIRADYAAPAPMRRSP